MPIIFFAVNLTSVYNERIAIILGLVTLALLLAVFFSCRTFISFLQRLGLKDPTGNRIYHAFSSRHAYYWWFFGVAVMSHFLISVLHTGLPQNGDPDASVHWAILGLGFVSALSSTAVFFSCRIYPRFVSPLTPKISMTNLIYRKFFKFHADYWLIIAIFAGVHFAVSFIHAGVWPQ